MVGEVHFDALNLRHAICTQHRLLEALDAVAPARGRRNKRLMRHAIVEDGEFGGHHAGVCPASCKFQRRVADVSVSPSLITRWLAPAPRSTVAARSRDAACSIICQSSSVA
jgi:hypothetical protein